MEYRLNLENITKTFPGVVAVNKANIKIKKGEVHALVGENGSGKSTLCMTLSGVYRPDDGNIYIDGERKNFSDPRNAQENGISMMYQESNLVPELTVAENIFLGQGEFISNSSSTIKKSEEILNKLNFEIDVLLKAKNLSGAQMQMVEIAKAMNKKAKIMIMDEPTAALSSKESKNLHKVIRDIAKTGVSVIYISHALDEALEIAENITVLRDGSIIACKKSKDLNKNQLVQLMVGREISDKNALSHEKFNNEEVLKVENISLNQVLNNINFSLYKGEILGFAGLVGSGRSELANVIYGLEKTQSGNIYVNGKKIKINSPHKAIKNGIAYLSENRKEDGLFLQLDILVNLTISTLAKICNFIGIVNIKNQINISNDLIKKFEIIIPNIKSKIQTLSGGNQQKALIARIVNINPNIIIFDEPTKGVDVGSIESIHNIIRELVKQGKSIIVISSYLPEILSISSRIIVMKNGSIVENVSTKDTSQEKIMASALN
tara:strand:- start:2025 stop:3500 length:1476 start_codon:yes stop_codon:yes gene_type:complete